MRTFEPSVASFSFAGKDRARPRPGSGSASREAPALPSAASAVQRRPLAPELLSALGGGAPALLPSWAALQRKRSGAASEPHTIQQAALAGVQGSGGTMPHYDKLQQAFGKHDLSQVKAFTGEHAAAAAVSIGASAYTVGNRVAFGVSEPSLHLAAHEAAHVIQQRAGVHCKGRVGQSGDVYERQADAVADAVVRGQSVEAMLGRPAAQSVSGAPSVQRNNVDDNTRQAILRRISRRGGQSYLHDISRWGTNERDTALAAVGVASMADDPMLEAAAERFEARIGALAYNHPRARAVCQRASNKILGYLQKKARRAQNPDQTLRQQLEALGVDDAGWSGAVGKLADSVMSVLKRGSLREQAFHIEKFTLNVLYGDLKSGSDEFEERVRYSGLSAKYLSRAKKGLKDNDSWSIFSEPEGTAAAEQWHTRVKATDIKQKTPDQKLPFHPSSLKPRLRPQLELNAPLGLGMRLGSHEAKLQNDASRQKHPQGYRQHLQWGEGAKVWMLNELDSWVAAQRALSLPLAGGKSGTTARMMQSFRLLNVGPPDDVRLAAIGALLPLRHHSLVEILYGAKAYGTSRYREGMLMYRDLKPLTRQEVLAATGGYPDEMVDPRGRYNGHSRHYQPLI